MSDVASPRAGTDSRRHLLLYDGVCGLCDRLVLFVLERDPHGTFRFASLQSPAATTQLARFGARADDLDTVSVITDYEGPGAVRLTKSRATCFVLSTFGWSWRAVAALAGVLPRALLDRAYDLIARNRYRVFGRLEQCALLRPEHVHRFLDTTVSVKSPPASA
jgi:predicted DCC family thiol-disulfide oxidoreductase YuxK